MALKDRVLIKFLLDTDEEGISLTLKPVLAVESIKSSEDEIIFDESTLPLLLLLIVALLLLLVGTSFLPDLLDVSVGVEAEVNSLEVTTFFAVESLNELLDVAIGISDFVLESIDSTVIVARIIPKDKY